MKIRPLTVALLLLSAALGSPTQACLWDSDTLQTEARGLPDVVEVITGFFPRNPPRYYEMRLERVTQALSSDPTLLNAYDDAAVACDRLHRPADAIEWMAKKEAQMTAAPQATADDDWYRYHANLGTFHAHQWFFGGRDRTQLAPLQLAKQHIERAIDINPDAHFGREKVQLFVIEYALADGGVLPQLKDRVAGLASLGDVLLHQMDGWPKDEIEGLQGLIALGAAWESPDVFEALRHLLFVDHDASLSVLAWYRMRELVEMGRPLMHLPNELLPDLSSSTVAFHHASEQQEHLNREFLQLRTEADAWQQRRTDYMDSKFATGAHPDTDTDFWADWTDPTGDPNAPTVTLPDRPFDWGTALDPGRHIHWLTTALLILIALSGGRAIVGFIRYRRHRRATQHL